MGKIVGYATVGMVLALAKKMAIQYGALGISDVRTTPDGSDLIFIMSDGSQHRVELNFSANGVDYDDSVTRFNVSNVQAAIEALFSELEAKQNTLTAGNGVSIENDTISVTDAGGLTVLKESDFPLSADLLAKVNANPQNYCYYNDTVYYYEQTNNSLHSYRTAIDYGQNGTGFGIYKYIVINGNNGTKINNSASVIHTDDSTVYEYRYNGSKLSIKGVRDTTDDSVKTGTQIRKAITIRKWH